MLNDKKIRANVLFQGFIQGANFVFPLIALPYLVRVLGVENYGAYALAGTSATFFGVFCDYGFNLTGTRDAAIAQKNIRLISLLFSKVMLLKIFLSLLSFIILMFFAILNQSIHHNFGLYFFSLTFVIAQSFFPGWLFVSLEDSKAIAILNCVAKLVFTASLFVFVHKQEDAYIAALLNTLGALVSTGLALTWLRHQYQVQFHPIPIKAIASYAQEGFFVFLAQLKILLFSGSNTIILGIIAGSEAVGFYSSAEKLMRAAAQIQVPILTVIFPKIASLMRADPNKTKQLLRTLLIYGVAGYLLLAGGVMLYAQQIIAFIFGANLTPSSQLLQIIILCPTFIFLNNIFGTQILLSLGKDREYFIVLLIVGLVNLGLCAILTDSIGATGTALSLVLSEAFVAFGMYYFSSRLFWRRGTPS